MENIFTLQYCIWGVGRYGRMFLKQLRDYSNICETVFNVNIVDNITYFIDSNTEKQKEELFCKQIKSPTYFFQDKNISHCIIATIRYKEIKNELESHGYRENINYITWEQMIKEFKKEILKRRSQVFKKYNLFLPNNVVEMEVNNAFSLIKKNLQNIVELNEKKNILRYVIFSVLIDYWKVSTDKRKYFYLLGSYFDITFIIAAFAWYYGNDITEVGEWFCRNINNNCVVSNKKQTIGLVVDRYYGGGIEKVVSLLMPLFVKNGHKVILITDSYNPELEYKIPKEVIRHVMNYNIEESTEERLGELINCAVENHVDIMCFHFGYTRIATFYEMLRLKLQHIAVLMEVHSAFLPLITEHKDVSKSYKFMYKMADRLIVLSNVDKLFWESLGCNCTYIQNPVEDSNERDINKKIRSSNCPIIVWVGRLVQIPKQIFDTIPIMKEVVKKIPCVKLWIVGAADEQWVYQSLVRQIEKNNLKDNIELCGYNSNIDEVYGEADLVLITSSSESFCNVIMESKIRSIPIVMYELPWLELLKDGYGYVAVEQGNTNAAAGAIVDLLNDVKMRERMSVESRKSIEPFINHDVYADWKQVFDDITTNRSSEISVCSEFAIIEKMLLNAVYDK